MEEEMPVDRLALNKRKSNEREPTGVAQTRREWKKVKRKINQRINDRLATVTWLASDWQQRCWIVKCIFNECRHWGKANRFSLTEWRRFSTVFISMPRQRKKKQMKTRKIRIKWAKREIRNHSYAYLIAKMSAALMQPTQTDFKCDRTLRQTVLCAIFKSSFDNFFLVAVAFHAYSLSAATKWDYC